MNEYTKYRLEVAAERVEVSKAMLDSGHFRDSVNRSYIKTGIFDVKYSDYIGDAFEFRNDCDYEDFIFASRGEAEEQYQHAFEFVAAVRNYLEGGELNVDD